MAVQLRYERLVGLVDAAARHDQRAVRELVEICGEDITQYCRRRGSVDGEALANLVFAEFFAALPRLNFDADQQVWAFLYRIARNRLVDEFRRQTLDPVPEMLIGVNDLCQPDPADRIVDRDWLRGLVGNLSVDQRQVIELRFGEDLSLAETAERTGKSVGAVKALQHRAVAALATLVAVTGLLLAIGLSQPSTDERIDTIPADDSIVDRNTTSVDHVDDLDDVDDVDDSRSSGPLPTSDFKTDVPQTTPAPQPPRPAATTATTVLDRPAPEPTVPKALVPESTVDTPPAVEVTSVQSSLPETEGEETETGNLQTETAVPAPPGGATTVVSPLPDGGLQADDKGPAAATQTVAPVPTETTVGETAAPLVVADDLVEYLWTGPGAVVQLDVLANDHGVDVKTVSVVGPPDVGTILLIPANALLNTVPLFHYVTGITPASTAMVYEACNAAGECQTATVSIIYNQAG